MMNNVQEITGSSETEGEFKSGLEDNFNLCPITLKTVVTECLNSWVNYLQVLNSFCSAGFRLSQCLVTLAQTQTMPLALQCHASWEELGKATIIASNTVKTHIAAAIQDMIICEPVSECDAQKQLEHNKQIIYDNLLTFINLQYQFSIAGCECFGNMATCPCCQTISGVHDTDCNIATLQRCFSKLYNNGSQMCSPHPNSIVETQYIETPILSDMQQPSPPLNREPSPVHSLPLINNRNTHLESIRGPFPAPGLLHTMKGPFRNTRSPLCFPLFPLSGQRRWSEVATGDHSSETSTDTMRRWSMPYDCARVDSGTKFHLPSSKLSAINHQEQRSRSNTPASVENVCNPSIVSSEGLVEAIQLLSSRSKSNHSGLTMSQITHEPAHSEHSSHKRLHHIQQHRSNWQSTDSTVGSRKSSSSTDSSSCLSIHSRSTSVSGSDGSGRNVDGGGESVRMNHHLYSIWSGSDHLPFIRLPESQEPLDDSDTESADNNTNSLYPRPI